MDTVGTREPSNSPVQTLIGRFAHTSTTKGTSRSRLQRPRRRRLESPAHRRRFPQAQKPLALSSRRLLGLSCGCLLPHAAMPFLLGFFISCMLLCSLECVTLGLWEFEIAKPYCTWEPNSIGDWVSKLQSLILTFAVFCKLQ
jgi:hypothetical protein